MLTPRQPTPLESTSLSSTYTNPLEQSTQPAVEVLEVFRDRGSEALRCREPLCQFGLTH
jgi:hypothetical protein